MTPLSSLLSELKNVFDVFTYVLLVPSFFFFQDTPRSFPLPCQAFLVLSIRAVPFLPPVNTNYQQKMVQTDIPTMLCGGKTGRFQTCMWVWAALTCATHWLPYIWCRDEESFTPLLASIFRHRHYSTYPQYAWEIQENQRRWWKSDGLYLKWNQTGIGLCHSTHVQTFFHFSLFLWHHCNNSPLAGTLRCLCVLWVMCCNPKWSSLTTEKKKKGYEHEH